MAQQARYSYEFGPFRIDIGKRLLVSNLEVVQLTPKCFDILLALVEGRGEIVSKDALMKRIWPDSFVEDNNLTYNISVLRKALGERAGDHQYIITAPGQGYRFTAEVKEVLKKPEEIGAESSTRPIRAHREVKSQAVIAAVLLVALTGILLYWMVTRPKSLRESRSTATVKSIAVLPLANGSGDPDMEYLSDGISEALINSLSQLPGIKVIARNSSFKYKGKDTDLQDVAQGLGVEAILTGRVMQRGETLLISVELMDARDRTHIWGEQYKGRATDLLALQAEISGEIVKKLRLKLTNAEQQQLAKRETINPEAYEIILRGRAEREKGGPKNLKSALEFYKRAIAMDPSYALAHAELSIIYGLLSASSLLDPKEYLPQAEAEARLALALDANLADAHYALANAEMNQLNWSAAGPAFERALELNPNLARARWRHALYLSVMEQHDQAIAEIERARELNPLSPRFKAYVSMMLLNAHRSDEAIKVLQNTLALDPNSGEALTGLGYAYLAKGMFAEAVLHYQKAIKLGIAGTSTQIYLGAAYARGGERNKALAILRQLQTSKAYVSPCELAVLYIALGQREAAFASLERAYAEHDLQLGGLGHDPGFNPIRSDSRFTDLMRRVGLPL